MGLDFSHAEVRWAYSGFHRFRKRLAREIGFKLEEMQGFGGARSFHTMNDPIRYLLDHSDCEGTLEPWKCRKIAPRLKQLVVNWPDGDIDKEKAINLAEGLEYCASKNRHMVFL